MMNKNNNKNLTPPATTVASVTPHSTSMPSYKDMLTGLPKKLKFPIINDLGEEIFVTAEQLVKNSKNEMNQAAVLAHIKK